MQSNNTLIPFLHTLFFTNILRIIGLLLLSLLAYSGGIFSEVVSCNYRANSLANFKIALRKLTTRRAFFMFFSLDNPI